MAEVNQREDVRNGEREHQEPAKSKGELIARNAAEITPFGVPQATFAEQMREGIPGTINRMVDYNAITRSAEGGTIPCCRAVSQSLASDIGCVIGGTAGWLRRHHHPRSDQCLSGRHLDPRRWLRAVFQRRRPHQGRDVRHLRGGDIGGRSAQLHRS